MYNFLEHSTEDNLALIIGLTRMISETPSEHVKLSLFLKQYEMKDKKRTPCGTVACLAGWAAQNSVLSRVLGITIYPPLSMNSLDSEVVHCDSMEHVVTDDIIKPSDLSMYLFSDSKVINDLFNTPTPIRSVDGTDREVAIHRLVVIAELLVNSPWLLHEPVDLLDKLRAFSRGPASYTVMYALHRILDSWHKPGFWERYAALLKSAVEDSLGQKSKLYYEAHITIEPVFGHLLELAQELAAPFKFRVADLLMKKREEDTPERSANDTFMTGHGTHLGDVTGRLRSLVRTLQDHSFKVWRYKIEDTILDSKMDKDSLNLFIKEPHHGDR